MRHRERVLQSLDGVYREVFQAAKERGEDVEMARLDLEYQRDQLYLELLLDIRELLAPPAVEEERGSSLLDKAQALRKITKLR